MRAPVFAPLARSNRLSLYVLVAFALGSGGAQPAAAALNTHGATRTAPNAVFANPLTSPLSGEVLTATNVEVVEVKCQEQGAHSTFSASGTATGPFPGSFTAKGGWRTRSLYSQEWIFHESFTIMSGTSEIHGHVAQLGGPGWCGEYGSTRTLKYTAGHWAGSASTTGISEGVFSETFL